MSLLLKDRDYVADGSGGVTVVQDGEELLSEVLFRLTAKRGAFPFWENLGSRLWALGRVPAPERQAAARQYVTEALSEEPVTVEEVTLEREEDGTVSVTARLRYEGESLPVTAAVLT